MKHQTNWNKTLADPNDYPSSWDWTVAHSEYHFDDTIQDQSRLMEAITRHNYFS